MENILKYKQQSGFFAPLRKSPFGGFRGLNRLVRSFLHDIEDEFRFDSISILLKTGIGNNPPPCKACAVEADVMAKNYPAALQEISVMEQQGTEPEFTLLQRTLIDMEAMPDKLMSVKTDSILKTTVEAVALQTNKKGSINARNLLNMAFKQKVKESYHFPQNNSSSARLIGGAVKEEITEENFRLSNLENKTLFNLFPNPNQGNFKLTYHLADTKEAKLEMINLTGTVVYYKTLYNTEQITSISLNNLSEGIYFLIVKNLDNQVLFNTKVGIIK